MISFRELSEIPSLSQLSIKELNALMSRIPYHPMLCFEIGTRLEESGKLINAKLFWSRGTVARALSPEYADKCSRKLNGHDPFTTSPIIKLDLKPFAEFMGKADYGNSPIAILKDAGGSIPAGTMQKPSDSDYKNGEAAWKAADLQAAYTSFCKSLSSNLSFDACNMAGNAARRISKHWEAIPLLLQALAINDTATAPWVHLSFAFKELDNRKMADFCLQKAKELPQDIWSEEQIMLLSDWLEKE